MTVGSNAHTDMAPAVVHVEIDPDLLEVEPGATATATASLSSTADGPLDVAMDVVGPLSSWCSISPARIRLPENGSTNVTVHVRLPDRLTSATSDAVLGIRATPRGSVAAPDVGELRIRVAHTPLLRLELEPSRQRVSRRGRFKVVVRNDTPVSTQVHLLAGDVPPDVRLRVHPSVADVGPHGTVRANAVVTAPVPWQGFEPDHRFTVVAKAGTELFEARGSVVFRTGISTALLAFAALLVVVGVFLLSSLASEFRKTGVEGNKQEAAVSTSLSEKPLSCCSLRAREVGLSAFGGDVQLHGTEEFARRWGALQRL